jgi:predicted small lipoprotein YifL
MFAPRTTFAQYRMLPTALLTMSLSLAGCGRETPPASGAAQAGKQADVIVTLDGVHHVCMVALAKEEHGSSIACVDITSFLKDELRLPAGATYDMRTTPEVSQEESTRVKENLNTAGYRLAGDR